MDRLAKLYDMVEPPIFETLAKGKHSEYEFFIVWCCNHPNAYVRIPKNHPFYKKDYFEIDGKYLVHRGGFTFSRVDLGEEYGLPKGWYLGWDYAHSTDFINIPNHQLDGFKWTLKDIERDCKEIIDSIIKEAE